MANAFMMRQDAKIFPVTIHYYAGDLDEAFASSEWLYSATMFPETRELVVKFLSAYAKNKDPEISPNEIAPTLKYVTKHLPYHTVTDAFIDSLSSKFEAVDISSVSNLSALHIAVSDALNQEFLRGRIGGLYDTTVGSKAIYFRTSSAGFDWFPLIWGYVYDNKDSFDAVTVMKDPEATGTENLFYKHGGRAIKDMPVEEFITLPGRPVFDSKSAEAPRPLFTSYTTKDLMTAHRMYRRQI